MCNTDGHGGIKVDGHVGESIIQYFSSERTRGRYI